MSLRVLPPDLLITPGANGEVYVRSPHPLAPYPDRLTDCLEQWASRTPNQLFLHERDPGTGRWRSITYAAALARVRRLAQALIDRQLSPSRPVAILSGNSIEHALLGLAAMHCGVPYVPVAPAYSLVATRFDLLRGIWAAVTPGLVFAAEGDPFEPALRAVAAAGTEIVTSAGHMTTLKATSFADLEAVHPSGAVDERRNRVSGDTVAKILFTSGSTSAPKGVITTQRMLCSNQEQIRAVLPFLGHSPSPVLCDWLPWNHTFGGSHNFGIVLYSGGTMYIDAGRPISGAPLDTTIGNLREIATTIYLNVPRGYDLLVAALRRDRDLRARFFSQLRVLFCAAASIKQSVADEMASLAMSTRGEPIPWITGLGATESSPFTFCTGPLASATASRIGLPAPGIDVKIVPAGEFAEARLRGPNITPGYWKDDELTRNAFDEEGFYKLGDLVRFFDPAHPEEGLVFEGRLNENFKLSTGTFARVGILRQALLQTFGDLVQDVVIAAPDRDELTALVFPNIARCQQVANAAPSEPVEDLLGSPVLQNRFAKLLQTLNDGQSGSAGRITRIALLIEPASFDAGEITDKGSVNQSAVLRRRADVVDVLYGAPGNAIIVTAAGGRTIP